ncbi:hypothetical protein VB636_06935, partial [Paracoccus sp. APAP_BH8]
GARPCWPSRTGFRPSPNWILTSQFIYLMLTSSVVSVISAIVLASAGADLNARTCDRFEIYLVLTILYFLLALGFATLFAAIRRAFYTYPASLLDDPRIFLCRHPFHRLGRP